VLSGFSKLQQTKVMVKFLFFILLTLIFQSANSQDNDVEVLTRLNQDWLNSYPKKDSTTLERIFADDFVLITPKS
jgi:hypothetical protein